jgi:hypothetical protein
MPKVVILNCPKRSGKDAVGLYLKDVGLPVELVSFKEKLIEIALCVSMIPKQEWDQRYEYDKEVPWDKLGGLSQREYLIKISEDWVKPVHGKDYFGKALVEKVKSFNDNNLFYIVTDGGFNEETQTVIDAFGINNVMIMQWCRNGSNWDGDSRNWVTCAPERTFQLENNNDYGIDTYASYVYRRILKVFNEADGD